MNALKAETLSRGAVITSLFAMNEQLKTFGINLRRQMELRTISPATLAERAGVSEKTVNNVINGRHATQIDNLTKLTDALSLEFWTMWLPVWPADATDGSIIQSLVECSTQLSTDALRRITRMAELELNAERAAPRAGKSPIAVASAGKQVF